MNDTWMPPAEAALLYSEDHITILQTLWGKGHLSPGGAPEIADILSGVSTHGSKILDLGVGLAGPALEMVRNLGAETVTGVDVSPMQIERARRNVAEASLTDRVFLKQVKAGDRLPFDDNVFDIVFSKEAINEIVAKEELFAELHRVLKPGGWFVASDWLSGDFDATEEFTIWASIAWPAFSFANASKMAEMLRSSKFTEIEFEGRATRAAHGARENLKLLLKLFSSDIQALTMDWAARRFALTLWQAMIEFLDSGQLVPTHFRARKPTVS